MVVGPKGQERYTDQYGRIKVQFMWDRESQCDSNSSCWLRVAQTNSGSHYGSQYIPLVGDEVGVQFQHGDPNRPIEMSSVRPLHHLYT
jgi:type VI secretion system secreted protein VgrG